MYLSCDGPEVDATTILRKPSYVNIFLTRLVALAQVSIYLLFTYLPTLRGYGAKTAGENGETTQVPRQLTQVDADSDISARWWWSASSVDVIKHMYFGL